MDWGGQRSAWGQGTSEDRRGRGGASGAGEVSSRAPVPHPGCAWGSPACGRRPGPCREPAERGRCAWDGASSGNVRTCPTLCRVAEAGWCASERGLHRAVPRPRGVRPPC